MTIEAMLLGIAQDAGVPQAGCACATCANARANPAQQRYTVCLGLVDHAAHACWMIDATPDFKYQHAALMAAAPGCELRGIFITHAHIGHYTGLIHAGKECMNARGLPVFGTASVCNFLRANAPWSFLVRNQNIVLMELRPGHDNALNERANIRALLVPHRDELTDTCAFRIQGRERSLFYCPDIDRWEDWDMDVRAVVHGCDISLIDGCFFSAHELTGRGMSQVPHPLISHTMRALRGHARDVRFVHLNHTNPVLDLHSPEFDDVLMNGFAVGAQGDTWQL